MITKTCTKCGECKPLDAFYRQAECLLGVTSQCKECRKAAVKAYSKTEKGMAVHAKARKKYASTDKGQALAKLKSQAPIAVAKRKEYFRTDRGIEIAAKARQKWRNSEAGKAYEKEYQKRQEVIERMKLHRKTYAAKPDAIAKKKAYSASQWLFLADSCVKTYIYKTSELSYESIPIELIKLQREKLQINRLLRQLKTAITTATEKETA